jgi:hypothetical protein
VTDWFYLSFADGNLPKGQQFLGGCYVRAPDSPMELMIAEEKAIKLRRGPVEPDVILLAAAVGESHRLGINPGGSVQSMGPISQEDMDENVPAADRERLLSREELERDDPSEGSTKAKD